MIAAMSHARIIDFFNLAKVTHSVCIWFVLQTAASFYGLTDRVILWHRLWTCELIQRVFCSKFFWIHQRHINWKMNTSPFFNILETLVKSTPCRRYKMALFGYFCPKQLLMDKCEPRIFYKFYYRACYFASFDGACNGPHSLTILRWHPILKWDGASNRPRSHSYFCRKFGSMAVFLCLFYNNASISKILLQCFDP